ncbi:hypothetical protein VPH35_103202 [Triticum aestivum]
MAHVRHHRRTNALFLLFSADSPQPLQRDYNIYTGGWRMHKTKPTPPHSVPIICIPRPHAPTMRSTRSLRPARNRSLTTWLTSSRGCITTQHTRHAHLRTHVIFPLRPAHFACTRRAGPHQCVSHVPRASNAPDEHDHTRHRDLFQYTSPKPRPRGVGRRRPGDPAPSPVLSAAAGTRAGSARALHICSSVHGASLRYPTMCSLHRRHRDRRSRVHLAVAAELPIVPPSSSGARLHACRRPTHAAASSPQTP